MRSWLRTSCIVAFCIILLLFSTQHLYSQNLAPNNSFETYTTCPTSYNLGMPLEAIPWDNGNTGSCDYFHPCSNPSNVGVPHNDQGYQNPFTGSAYTGMITKTQTGDYHEYLQAPLVSSMVAGITYHVSFYVSLADSTCGTEHMGAYFSATPPNYNLNNHINVIPQIDYIFGFLSDTFHWTLITGCYTAVGGESYITIGNFYSGADTHFDPEYPGTPNLSYYYIDEIQVIEGPAPEEIFLELGDPVSACTSYEIDPDIQDVSYHWEDGSTGSTLIVYESGTYSLTVTNGCNFAIDSLEVTIEGSAEPVNLGTDEVTICAGEQYNISLDPQWNYEWNTGSTSSDISITTGGTYSVTMDDGCDISFDEIEVFVINPPQPFSLGEDTQLCPGDVIDIQLDPDLGDFIWQDNSTSSNYTIDEEGTYSLTISNECGEVSDEIEVTLLNLPIVEIGDPEMNLCVGSNLAITLDPLQGEYVWQDGSTESTYQISTEGNYSVTVSNVCGSASDMITVTVINAPAIELGEDIILCPAELPYIIDLSNTPDATDYLWQNGSTASSFIVLSSGHYIVTVSNECFDDVDDIEITVQSVAPEVHLPDDLQLCPGETFLLSNTGDDGDFLWQDNSMESTLLVSAAGTYSLTVTSVCGSGSDTINIDYLPLLSNPDLGTDILLCPGQTAVLNPHLQGVTYLWNDLSTGDTLLVSTPGIYSVSVSDQCASAADTIVVSFDNNPPQIDLPDQLQLCQGDQLTIDAGISGVNYLWNDGSTNSTLDINSPGEYSLTISNTCGSDVDTVIITDGGPAPAIDLGNDIVLCPGDTISLSPVFTDVVSWQWSSGETSSDIEITSGGVTSVIVSNSCGTAYDTILANLLPDVPAFTLGNDTAICEGEVILLSITVPNVDITWPDGSQLSLFTVNASGQYFASIANACGEYTDTIQISQLPDVPDLNLGNDQSLCPGELIVIDPGIADVDYLWDDGSAGMSYSTTQADTIILEISNSCGTSIDTVIVSESTQGPQVDLGEDISGCVGETVTIHAGISGVDYLWQDGSVGSSFITNTSGEIIVNVSNNCGADADTILVDLSGTAPSVYLGSDTSLCDGDALLLEVNTSPQTMVTWQDGSVLPAFDVHAGGLYHVTASNTCGQSSDTIAVTFTLAPLPFDLGPDTILCTGESITLTSPATTDIIQWQDGTSGTSLIADQDQLYSLQISNGCGTVDDTIRVSFIGDLPVFDFDETISICPGDIISLDATQSFPAQYIWSTGSVGSQIAITTPGHYTLTVTTDCFTEIGEIDIVSADDCKPKTQFYIPNLFSPNGDGQNDAFEIKFNATAIVKSIAGEIYDRWGNLLFSSQDIPFQWDGTSHWIDIESGSFVYRVTIQYSNGIDLVIETLTGDVTIVR